MTEQAGGSRLDRGMPVEAQRRRVVASFSSYRDAERAVDFLSDQRFPVQRLAIVGRDLQTVEQVTGRMGDGKAALAGAAQGAPLGLLVHAMSGGRRDFASVSGMPANRYDVMVDDEVADEAARLLGQQPA
jgi:hypothetical protein